jgi:hypothetical protein
MTDDDFIKQLTTYADAVTGFSFVQALAFVYAIAQEDNFAKHVFQRYGPTATTVCIIVGTCVYCLLVYKCMEWAAPFQAASGRTAKVARSIQKTRFAIIVTGGALSIATLWLIYSHRLASPTGHV